MINRVLSLLGFITLGYLLFCVPLAGMNLAAHLTDLWRSDCVQNKVQLISDEIRRKNVTKMAKEALEKGMKLAIPPKDTTKPRKAKRVVVPPESQEHAKRDHAEHEKLGLDLAQHFVCDQRPCLSAWC